MPKERSYHVLYARELEGKPGVEDQINAIVEHFKLDSRVRHIGAVIREERCEGQVADEIWRPGIYDLIRVIQQGDRVVAWDEDIIATDLPTLVEIERRVTGRSAVIRTVHQVQRSGLDTMIYKFLCGLVNTQRYMEIEYKRAHQRHGIENRYNHKGQRVRYGWAMTWKRDRFQMVPVPEEIEVIRIIESMRFGEGKAYRAIADKLNSEGYLRRNLKPWSSYDVRQLARLLSTMDSLEDNNYPFPHFGVPPEVGL